MGRHHWGRVIVNAAVIGVVLVALLTTDGYGASRMHPRNATDFALPTVSVVATRGALDPTCAGGRAVVFPGPGPSTGGTPLIVATSLAKGLLVMAMSPGGGSGSTIDLRSFDANCEPNVAFGDRGVESFVPMIRHRPVQSLAITSITPALGGGFLLVGHDLAGGLVGRIDSNGVVDKSFGTEGWTEIPSLLDTGPVMQEPSGRIVVAGLTDGNLVWPEWVVALSSAGIIDQNFGSKGRAPIPAYHDASIESLASEPNGVIVALTTGGNMGCWGSTIHAVTSSGSVDEEFNRHVQQVFPGLFGQPPFDAGMALQDSRILMIGTSQPTCVEQKINPDATGRAVAFNAKGQLDATFGAVGEVYFKSAMQQPVAVLPGLDHGWFLVGEPPIYQSQAPSQTVLNVVSLKASARINPRFASGGRASVQLPTLGENELFTFLSPVTASVGHAVALIVPAAGGKNLMLFRVGHP